MEKVLTVRIKLSKNLESKLDLLNEMGIEFNLKKLINLDSSLFDSLVFGNEKFYKIIQVFDTVKRMISDTERKFKHPEHGD